MDCPACATTLTQTKAGEILVDACAGGCGGLWFDNFELMKVDEPAESAGAELLDIPRDASIEVDHEAARTCPKCEDTAMLRHLFNPAHKVEVDECPRCAGVWLDAGELSDIRTGTGSDEERKQAAEAYFDDIFGKDLAKMKESRDAQSEKVRRFAHLFRFVCPSYWIPGKQKWGAF
jgi:Zn-finger nucleic acid-binding protein